MNEIPTDLTMDVAALGSRIGRMEASIAEIDATLRAFQEAFPPMQVILGGDVEEAHDPVYRSMEASAYRQAHDAALELTLMFLRSVAVAPLIDWRPRGEEFRSRLHADAERILGLIFDARRTNP